MSDALTKEQVVTLVNSRKWYHRFEIIDGVMTPGICPVDGAGWVESTFAQQDLAGKRCLEIGTWDGPYAFALEAKGAQVEAIDVLDPDKTGFNLAKRVRNSQVRYTRTSVYEVDRHFEKDSFDCILFCGVYYHLKYPVLAFEKVSTLLKRDGGQLHFEGECLLNYAPRRDGSAPSWFDRVLLMRRAALSDYPFSVFYSGEYKNDRSNWHIPNFACLKEWFATAGLEIRTHRFTEAKQGTGHWKSFPTQRVSGVAIRTGEIKEEG